MSRTLKRSLIISTATCVFFAVLSPWLVVLCAVLLLFWTSLIMGTHLSSRHLAAPRRRRIEWRNIAIGTGLSALFLVSVFLRWI